MSSLGTFRFVAEGTLISTRYLPLVGPSAAETLYWPSLTVARTLTPPGASAMKRIVPLAPGLPLTVSLPSSLPRLGGAGPRVQAGRKAAVTSSRMEAVRIGGLKIAQRFARADAAGGDPGEE